MSTLRRVLAVILLAPPVLLVAGIGGCEARKAYYDWQVRRMCETDGGVKIFERVMVTESEARQLPKVGGFYGAVTEGLSKGTEPAFSRTKSVSLREGDISIARYEREIVRRSDGRVVARAIRFGRGGGDFPIGGHPSTFYCPDDSTLYASVHAVYQIEDQAK